MNGPDHYREAERTLSLARCATADQANGTEPNEAITMMLAAAQVHATLALAAATALTGPAAVHYFTDEPELVAWHEAAGVKPEPAAQVRIDSLSLDDVVRHPDLFEGNDVCIVEVLASNEALAIPEGYVRVRYRFSIGSTYQPCSLDVPADTLVTPVGGA